MDRLKEIEDEIELAHRAIEDAEDRLEELEAERLALLGGKPAGPDMTIQTAEGYTLGLYFGNDEARAELERTIAAGCTAGRWEVRLDFDDVDVVLGNGETLTIHHHYCKGEHE